ncbi:mismatch-specific DNA-glycosylase [Paenirhodobacter populi]|uniref:mismatch-specific DNA-glycosylase n=1 Tax=Paenirhodobacter populi TaxID=2306993 RepID=UPI000FE43C35|nr:mismatch-specific DNA-glycosylase [Sinirhodobacter populi]RWR10745.1 mismatch-specific DNA-glycosylase [Sinirhodobacter populi]
MILPDFLGPGLRAVFCGTAAGRVSAERGHYYAGPGNRFWPILHPAGIVPEPLAVGDEARLLAQGIGLTDMAKLAFGPDAAIPRTAYDPARLRDFLLRHRPRSLAFNGKNAAQRFFGTQVAYGPQPGTEIPVWVLPSTSGMARRYWDPQPWHDFGAFLKTL